MKALRFAGRYEVERIDRYNVGVFEVCDGPVPERLGGVRNRKSDDGKTLRHLGSYYGSYGAAVRAVAAALFAEGIESGEARSCAEAIERAAEGLSEVADRIGEAARRLEAAR